MEYPWQKVGDAPTNEQELWAKAVNYFNWAVANPIKLKKTVMTGKEAGAKVDVEYVRPMSIKAFCLHANVLEDYIQDIFSGKDRQSLYFIVVSKIIYIIHEQNQSMAMIGEYNGQFVTKLLNMERPENNNSNIQVMLISDTPTLSQSETEILENIRLEKGNIEFSKR